jgi:hypothetical protein
MDERKPAYPDLSDPTKESMNNFHGHMPGGFYRPSNGLKQGFMRKAMSEYLQEFATR